MTGKQERLGRGWFGAAVLALAFLVLVLAITSGVARGAGAAQPGAPLAGESLHPSYRLGAGHPTCRLNLTGSIDCWTGDNDGKATTQIGPYVQVGSGGGHSCGLRPDGSVDCWGRNNYGPVSYTHLDVYKRQRYGLRLSRYLTPFTAEGIAIRGQPEPQLYFHRPLGELLQPFLSAGFALDALEEAAFPPGYQPEKQTSWGGNYSEFPPVLVARLKR